MFTFGTVRESARCTLRIHFLLSEGGTRKRKTLESECDEEKAACMQLTILAIFSFPVEDLTEKQSGSKREFQGCPNIFHFMCLFIKPVIFGTASLAKGRPNLTKMDKKNK